MTTPAPGSLSDAGITRLHHEINYAINCHSSKNSNYWDCDVTNIEDGVAAVNPMTALALLREIIHYRKIAAGVAP